MPGTQDRDSCTYFLLFHRLPNPCPALAFLFSSGFKFIVVYWICHGYSARTSNSKLLKPNSGLSIHTHSHFLHSLFQFIFPVTKTGKLSHMCIILFLPSSLSVNRLPEHAYFTTFAMGSFIPFVCLK